MSFRLLITDYSLTLNIFLNLVARRTPEPEYERKVKDKSGYHVYDEIVNAEPIKLPMRKRKRCRYRLTCHVLFTLIVIATVSYLTYRTYDIFIMLSNLLLICNNQNFEASIFNI